MVERYCPPPFAGSVTACRKLTSMGLQGSIPSPGGWQLPATLQVLGLGNNSIKGSIPSDWQLPSGLESECSAGSYSR